MANANGVNYLETFKGDYTFKRDFRSAGCGSATVEYGFAGRDRRPDSVRWYVGSGNTCRVLDTFLVEFGYQPEITFSTNNYSFSTPSLTKLAIRGYDFKAAVDLIGNLGRLLTCTNAKPTSCSVKMPISLKFNIGLSFEKALKVNGWEFCIEIGNGLKRAITRLLAGSITCGDTICCCTVSHGCSPSGWDFCRKTESTT